MHSGNPRTVFLFLVAFATMLLMCQAQWENINPDDLKCSHQKTHSDCKLLCGCGWCDQHGCFKWPIKSHKSHAYRKAFGLCDTTNHEDIKTRYYKQNCVFERIMWTVFGFAVLSGIGIGLLACTVFFVLGVYTALKRFLCGTGYSTIPG